MSDRRVQKQLTNQVNEKYWETRNSLQKMFNNGQIDKDQLQSSIDNLNKINKQHQEKIAEAGDDLSQLNQGKSITVKKATPPSETGMFSNVKSKLKSTADDVGRVIGEIAPAIDDVAKVAGKVASSPIAKKAGLALASPLAAAAMTAQDAMASEDVGAGSDKVDQYMQEEALLENSPENFADKDVAEQARRWQKTKSLMER